MISALAEAEQQFASVQQQQEDYAVQQLSAAHQAYHAANGDAGQLTQEGLAAALQLASDQALGLAAQVDGVDGVDALGQVAAHRIHGAAVLFAYASFSMACDYQQHSHVTLAEDYGQDLHSARFLWHQGRLPSFTF